MKKSSRYYLVCLLAFLANLSLLCGCMQKKDANNNSKSNEPWTDKSTLNAEKNHALKLNFSSGEPSCLNPLEMATSTRDSIIGKMLFEGLTRLDSSGKWSLAGADSVDISPCATRYIFTLRPNQYPDGSFVTADDYLKVWQQAIDPTSKCEKAYLFYCIQNAEAIKKGQCPIDQLGVKVLNQNKLVIDLTNPTPHFMELLASISFVPFKEKSGHVLGSGPYKVKRWDRGKTMELEANEHFWDSEQLAIHDIHLSFIQDSITALCMKEKNEISWIGQPFTPLPDEVIEAQDHKNQIFTRTVNCPLWVYFNTTHPNLPSSIRRALSLALDREVISKHIYFGSRPLSTPLPTDLSFLPDQPEPTNSADAREMFEKGTKAIGKSRESFPPLVILSSSSRKKLAQYMQQRWQDVLGIDVRIQVQEWNSFVQNLVTGNYQVAAVFVSSDYNSGLSYLERLTNPQNFAFWKNPLFNELVDASKKEKDMEKRGELLRQAEEILEREVPIAPLVLRALHYSHVPELKNIVFNATGIPDFRWAYFEDTFPSLAEERSTPPSQSNT